MKEQKYYYSQRIGKTTFIVNVKQSESAKKPLNTVFQDICKHEALGGFFTDKSFNLVSTEQIPIVAAAIKSAKSAQTGAKGYAGFYADSTLQSTWQA